MGLLPKWDAHHSACVMVGLASAPDETGTHLRLGINEYCFVRRLDMTMYSVFCILYPSSSYIIIFIFLSGTSFNVNLSVGGSFNHENASAYAPNTQKKA